MDFTAHMAEGRQLIEGYGNGGFRVSGAVHRGSVLVFADRTLAWAVSDMAALSHESLAAVRQAEPRIEVLLLGCGAKAMPVPAALRESLRADGVVIEAMDTGAACRTFNLLIAEERRAAAALIAVD
ncbi:MAG TPA: Mth938-like domain-containing protein [Kiloniellales bacterium]